MTKRVLTVGNCAYDHGNLATMTRSHFQAEILAAANADEALTTLAQGHFDLVLINRLLENDRSSGVELIGRIKADPALSQVPLMLISNFADAQQQAIDAGARPGFSKKQLGTPETIAKLKPLLG